MLSHRNLFSTFKSFMLTLDLEAFPGDTYIAFLPLAHVLELICETMLSMYGVRIGYSTPNTLSDRSSMIKKGSAGDASMLRPTIMAAVPLILDRVYKTITDTLKRRGPGFENFFNFCFEYRLAATRRGESTPILDFLVFRSLRSLFGGRLRLMITGSNFESLHFKCFQETPISVLRWRSSIERVS
jgi:long-chain acyl-CoA synthetase